MDDADLLHRYVRHADQAAFTELVQRHLGFVYAAALRQVGGDAHLAQDVAQTVFADVARKAAALAAHPVLKGWLFTSTRFAAAKIVRRERLRLVRETRAVAMQNEDGAATSWEELRPLLDEVMSELKAGERDAVLVRFFEGEGFARVGARLGISEDAARMRVERALERLKTSLARRGVTSTPAALAGLLSAQGAVAVPVELVHTVAGAALTQAAAAPAGVFILPLVGTKVTLGVAGVAAAIGLLLGPAVGVAFFEARGARRTELAAASAQRRLEHDLHRLRALALEAGNTAAEVEKIQGEVAQAKQSLAEAERASRAAAALKPADPHRTGARFLAAYPEAREDLVASGTTRSPRALLDIFARAGLSAAQIDALNTRIWVSRVDNLTLAPGSLGWDVTGLPPDDEVRALLGDAGFAEYREFVRFWAPNEAAAEIASLVAYDAPPLTAPQVRELGRMLAQLKPSAALAPGTPEWETWTAPLRTLMSAEQWQAAEGATARIVFPLLLDWTQRQARSASTAKAVPPKP